MPQTNAIYNLAAVEASTEQVPVVGYTVLWRLHGLRVKHDQLKGALDRAGFLEFLPDPPTPRKSLRRALQAWVVARARAAMPSKSSLNKQARRDAAHADPGHQPGGQRAHRLCACDGGRRLQCARTELRDRPANSTA